MTAHFGQPGTRTETSHERPTDRATTGGVVASEVLVFAVTHEFIVANRSCIKSLDALQEGNANVAKLPRLVTRSRVGPIRPFPRSGRSARPGEQVEAAVLGFLEDAQAVELALGFVCVGSVLAGLSERSLDLAATPSITPFGPPIRTSSRSSFFDRAGTSSSIAGAKTREALRVR